MNADLCKVNIIELETGNDIMKTVLNILLCVTALWLICFTQLTAEEQKLLEQEQARLDKMTEAIEAGADKSKESEKLIASICKDWSLSNDNDMGIDAQIYRISKFISSLSETPLTNKSHKSVTKLLADLRKQDVKEMIWSSELQDHQRIRAIDALNQIYKYSILNLHLTFAESVPRKQVKELALKRLETAIPWYTYQYTWADMETQQVDRREMAALSKDLRAHLQEIGKPVKSFSTIMPVSDPNEITDQNLKERLAAWKTSEQDRRVSNSIRLKAIQSKEGNTESLKHALRIMGKIGMDTKALEKFVNKYKLPKSLLEKNKK